MRVWTELQVKKEKGRAYYNGVNAVREAWKSWFEELPAELQNAILEADAHRRQRDMWRFGC